MKHYWNTRSVILSSVSLPLNSHRLKSEAVFYRIHSENWQALLIIHVMSSYFKYLFWSAWQYCSFISFLEKRMLMKMAGDLRATMSAQHNLAFTHHRKVHSMFFQFYSIALSILIKTSSSEMSHLVITLKILWLGTTVLEFNLHEHANFVEDWHL